MEFMQYRSESTFQGSPVTTQSGVNEDQVDVSVEDLVLSMRQDLLVTNVIDQAGSNGVSVHRQPGAVSLRINGVGLRGVENELRNIENVNGPVTLTEGHDGKQPYQQVGMVGRPPSAGGVPVPRNISPSYSQKMSDDTECNLNQMHCQQLQNASASKMPGTATHHANPNMSNGFVRQNKAQPQLASQFYQQLRMSWGPSSQNSASPAPGNEHNQPAHSSEAPIHNGAPQFEPDISPRMLPKPPQEPRRGSRTRSSLRRAANLLLNRSRQSLSDGETARQPTPPSTPRDETEHKKENKSQTIRERLQKNKSRMGDLLRSPNLSRVRRPSQGNISTDGSMSPPDTKTDYRKYASAENLQGIEYRSSTENLNARQTGKSAKQSSSRSVDAFSSRSEDTDEQDCMRGPSTGYKLRRHASGPIYQTSSETRNIHRGYHTADSDTDSGVGRANTKSAQAQSRKESNKAVPSTRDTLRMLSKKRDVTGTSGRHMGKSVSGPLRADHNIQPVSGAVNTDYGLNHHDERSPADKPGVWSEQGARPKRSNSVESIETEEVRHEIFPDTPIRTDRSPQDGREEQEHQRTTSSVKSDGRRSKRDTRPPSPSRSRPPSPQQSRPSSSSRSRPPSPSRSVHFEDSNSPRGKESERRPRSGSHSRTQPNPDQGNHQALATTAQDEVQSRGRGHIEDAYSSIDDSSSVDFNQNSRIITDENPYEEIQIPDRAYSKKREKASRTPVTDDWNDMDSVDGLYAKVEKKRQEGKKERSTNRRKENSNAKNPNSTSGPGDKALQATGQGEPIYAQVDKSKKKPPSGDKNTSRHRSQSDASSQNPCVTSDFDDSISRVGNDSSDGSTFKRNFEHYSDLSGSRLSVTSRASISEKVQSVGKATKKKLTSMRRALSLDRIDTSTKENDTQPKLKRSPSLRSLTGLFSKKDKKQESADSPGKLNKRRSASLSGLHVRPQRTSEGTDVTSPSHMRKVGKLLNINSDGSQIVELIKPPSGPFGFYIARGTSNFGSGVFVTRLGDGHPAKILAGLLAVGDEILDINGVDVRNRPIDDVYDMMMDNDKLILRLVPIATRSMWTD
ncbi:serine/arginine repetitive matrix protein 1-like [Patiria miniata]|uniref:PDZ domain-containing protein n=1 Tax=Patiria miniata TaxID=46514 RepID=A0A914AJF3_PATMI|nr:serine/arginine repetitive matrix protein 1-like [Patiria miniata]